MSIKATYVDHMGSDLSVVNAARVSFGKKSSAVEWGWLDIEDRSGELVAILDERDTKLIKYLADHKHYSPFGHCFASFHIKAPIFVARQLVKHEYLRMNEISRRYVTSEPEFYVPDVWRKMAENVKQGSSKEQLVVDGVKVCAYCKSEMTFLRKEDETMKVFCSSSCQGHFYRKYTDKGWAVSKHSSLRESAQKRGIEFNLTLEDLLEIGRPKYCKYLELELDYAATSILPNSPSVNRIDPDLGYVKGNLEVISHKANSMLLNATRDELRLFLKNVALAQFGLFTESAPSVEGYYEEMKKLYARLIEGGMCAEQARMFMPTSQLTEWYWSGSMDAFANMCNLRLKEDTQYETRLVAQQIDKVMGKLYPVSWKALVGEH